jgi:hypothetical protein
MKPQNLCLGVDASKILLIETNLLLLPIIAIANPKKITQKARTK